MAALALAVFPSFVAVSRDNGVDPLLLLLMILACGAALNAIEDGRWRWLMACAVLVGLAFNTKTLAAYLIVPGIGLAYLVCAPGAWYRRIGMLAVAGVVMGICSFAWIAAVELTPASQRPYVGSSTNNTELGLTFEYNGLGRVEGEVGGPGKIPVAEGGLVRTPVPIPSPPPAHPAQRALAVALERREAERRELLVKQDSSTYLPNGRLRDAIAFGGETGPMRLFENRLADQGSWMLPFAIFGMLALALLTARRRAQASQPTAGLPDRVRRLAARGGGDPQPLQRHRPPLLHLRHRSRGGRDGRRGRVRFDALCQAAHWACCCCPVRWARPWRLRSRCSTTSTICAGSSPS